MALSISLVVRKCWNCRSPGDGSAPAQQIVKHFGRQEFRGHRTMQPCVLGLVDDAHSAATQLLNNAVVRDGLADQR